MGLWEGGGSRGRSIAGIYIWRGWGGYGGVVEVVFED